LAATLRCHVLTPCCCAVCCAVLCCAVLRPAQDTPGYGDDLDVMNHIK
jgi:hypothetical protein